MFSSVNSEESKNYLIDGRSKNVEIDLVDESFKAEGKSEVSYENITVQAKKIRRVEQENKIIAEGDIGFFQDSYRVFAKHLELDLENKIAKVTDGRTELNKFHLKADNIEAKFPDILKAKKAYVTTCDLDEPHFRIEADSVDFYPDAKFVAYRGWIYIGKNFKLFPVPIYASYVVEKEDRAPLFPTITYDEAKGTMVIYGFDYQVYKDEEVLGIPNVNLDFLLNLEYSANRGLGVNKLRTSYSMMKNKNFKGFLQIKDWVKAKTERIDSNFENTSPVEIKNRSSSGSSYKFETVNELVIDEGYLFELKDTHVLGPSKSKLDLKVTDSDLIKDSQGNYSVLGTKEKYTQVDINIDQKVWKMLDVKYRYLGIIAEKRVLENLTKKLDDEIEESVLEESAEIDTRIENHLQLTHSDGRYHKFGYERKRSRDIRPEKGRSGKSKEDRRDFVGIEFRRLGVKLEYEDSFKDLWSSRSSSLDVEKSNYVSSDSSKNRASFELGRYSLFGTKFTHSYSIERVSSLSRSFDVPDPSIDPETDYENRESNIIKREKEAYIDSSAEIGHTGIFLGEILKIDPRYRIDLRKYLESKEELEGYSKFFDSLIHNFAVAVPIYAIDNSKVVNRSVDLNLTVTPSLKLSYFVGDFPKDQKEPTNRNNYSSLFQLNMGNIGSNYRFGMDRDFYAKKKFMKYKNFLNEGSINIGSQRIFTFRIINNSSWEVEDSDPNYTFSQEYSSDMDYLKVDFKNSYEKRYNRSISDKNTVRSTFERHEYKFGANIMGLGAKYERSLSHRYDRVQIKDISNIIENRVELSFTKDFERLKRKYEIYANYRNEYDEITSEFKDSTLGFEMAVEDRNSIKKVIMTQEEEDEDDFDELESDFFDFESFQEEDIDKIIEINKNKSKRNIMDLGREKKRERVDDGLKKIGIKCKIVHDAGYLNEAKLSWPNYQASWKRVNIDLFLKYSTFFELSYKINKKREDISSEYTEDTRELDVRIGFGREDYEWWPGFHIKDNKADSRVEKIYGRLDHNIHCTKLSMKLGKARDTESELVWMFGFELSISEFPEKAFGMDIREDKVENVKFGL